MVSRFLISFSSKRYAIAASLVLIVTLAALGLVAAGFFRDPYEPTIVSFDDATPVPVDGGTADVNEAEAQITGHDASLMLIVLAQREQAIESDNPDIPPTMLISWQLQITPDTDLPADAERVVLVIVDEEGNPARIAPIARDNPAPDLAQMRLSAGESATGWVSFLVPMSSGHGDLGLRPVGGMEFVAEVPVGWGSERP